MIVEVWLQGWSGLHYVPVQLAESGYQAKRPGPLGTPGPRVMSWKIASAERGIARLGSTMLVPLGALRFTSWTLPGVDREPLLIPRRRRRRPL